jgi:anti-sigma B factor antagonist
MNITTSQQSGWMELRVEGRLDAISSEKFFEAVCEQALRGQRDIRVDASLVNYISSAGLRALLQSQRKLSSQGGSFAVVKASDFVAQTLAMSGLDSLLTK